MAKLSTSQERDDFASLYAAVERRERHLTATQRKLLEYTSLADDLIRRHGINDQSRKLFTDKTGLSTRHARRYFDNAIELYGTQPRKQKEYWKGVVMEKLSTLIADLYSQHLDHMKESGAKADNELVATLLRAMAEMRKTVGYDREEMDTPPPGSEVTHVVINSDPEKIGAKEWTLDEINNAINDLASDDAQVIEESPTDQPEQ